VSYSEALEQQVDLWSRWRDGVGFVGRSARALKLADTYWLGSEVDELVWAGVSSLPQTVRLTPDLLPSPHGFLSLERPRRVLINDGQPGILRAVQWSDVDLSGPGGTLRRGISSLSYISVDGSPPIPAMFSSWVYGETIHESLDRELKVAGWNGAEGGVRHDLTDDDKRMTAAQALLLGSFWLFVRQSILVTPLTTAERHVRRRIERTEWPSSPVIRVVQLRRRESRSTHEVTPTERDWSCQWVVRGHWRQQFYPSKHANLPIWITPYVKGPQDKPLRPPRATVFAVVR
jgi:hypothetical protein